MTKNVVRAAVCLCSAALTGQAFAASDSNEIKFEYKVSITTNAPAPQIRTDIPETLSREELKTNSTIGKIYWTNKNIYASGAELCFVPLDFTWGMANLNDASKKINTGIKTTDGTELRTPGAHGDADETCTSNTEFVIYSKSDQTSTAAGTYVGKGFAIVTIP